MATGLQNLVDSTAVAVVRPTGRRIPAKYQDQCGHCGTDLDKRSAYRSDRTGSYYCNAKCFKDYTED